ncbi:hypothetical protein D3C73_1340310 [compost metagenome]
MLRQDKRNIGPVGLFGKRLAAYRAGQRRSNQHQRDLTDFSERHAGGQGFGPPGNAEIGFVGLHFVDRIGGVTGGQFYFYQWMLCAEAIEDRRQVAVGGGNRAKQP